MKQSYLVIFALAAFLSCKQEPSEPEPVVVTGQIENAKKDSIAFKVKDDILKFAVSEDGSFKGSFDAEPGYYDFSYLRENATAYLSPGDSLNISFDTQQFDETMRYSGTAADENNYLAAKFLLLEKMGQEMDTRTFYTMPEDSFLMALEQNQERVQAHLGESSVSDAFNAIEKKSIMYEFHSDLMNYETYHAYFGKLDSFKVSEELQSRIDAVTLDNEQDYREIPQYRDMVNGHYVNMAFNEGMEEVVNNLANDESDYLKENVILYVKSFLGPGEKNLKTVVDKMKSMVTDQEVKTELEEMYETLKVLSPGNNSPGFNFKSIDDTMVSLEDLRGKNVYIDVWATWCGPCKAEIPHLKDIESDYHGENIEFVSISVDVPRDEQKWRDMVEEKELRGVQLISENGWDTDFIKNYLIKGIPRFILIDAQGKIVSADAPRPSNTERLKGMIDELLVQA